MRSLPSRFVEAADWQASRAPRPISLIDYINYMWNIKAQAGSTESAFRHKPCDFQEYSRCLFIQVLRRAKCQSTCLCVRSLRESNTPAARERFFRNWEVVWSNCRRFDIRARSGRVRGKDWYIEAEEGGQWEREYEGTREKYRRGKDYFSPFVGAELLRFPERVISPHLGSSHFVADAIYEEISGLGERWVSRILVRDESGATWRDDDRIMVNAS